MNGRWQSRRRDTGAPGVYDIDPTLLERGNLGTFLQYRRQLDEPAYDPPPATPRRATARRSLPTTPSSSRTQDDDEPPRRRFALLSDLTSQPTQVTLKFFISVSRPPFSLLLLH